ncbi:hypothetical protein [Lentzea californiensis]|uniref:hypothetical protein n=1 Tax=Lentzea californiensis TaxID=438851 RepID=UPI002166A46F|nr:hypothetical protein [Lentzea californiensis]MCR3752230.1 hypothetical protein [Lentzea californiensis]
MLAGEGSICVIAADADVPEYDTVLVVDPARVVDAEAPGLQRLHVALTRVASTLHVVHAKDLPGPLAER